MAVGVGEADGVRAALAEALSGVWAADGVPLAERRRLAARVATAPLLTAASRGVAVEAVPGGDGFTPIAVFQDALAAAGEVDDVVAAKKKLRALGDVGVRLASRVSKASKLRNAAAHIDVGLAAAVRKALAVRTDARAGSCSSCCGEGREVQQRGPVEVAHCGTQTVAMVAGPSALGPRGEAAEDMRVGEGRAELFDIFADDGQEAWPKSSLAELAGRVGFLEARMGHIEGAMQQRAVFNVDEAVLLFEELRFTPSEVRLAPIVLLPSREQGDQVQSGIQALPDGQVDSVLQVLSCSLGRTFGDGDVAGGPEEIAQHKVHWQGDLAEAIGEDMSKELPVPEDSYANIGLSGGTSMVESIGERITKELPALALAELAGSSAPLVEGVEDIAVEKEPMMSVCAASSSAGRGKLSRQRRARAARAAAAAEASAAAVPVRPVRSWAEVNAELRCIMEERARKAFALRGIAPTSEDLEMEILRREIAFLEGG